jgi:regulatory protein
MRTRLERASIGHAEAEAVIAELVEHGHLDDARYARVFAQDKRGLESWGWERISRALSERGVEADLIAAALGGEGDESEHERAVELLHRRFPSPGADPRERERALGVLLRKGYETDVAYDAVRTWSAGVSN